MSTIAEEETPVSAPIAPKKDAWNVSKRLTTESSSLVSISANDWPSLDETAAKLVNGLSLVVDESQSNGSNLDSNSPATTPISASSDSGNESCETNGNFLNAPSSNSKSGSENGFSDDGGDLANSATLSSSTKKKCSNKPKWIPLPLPDLPSLKQRKGRRVKDGSPSKDTPSPDESTKVPNVPNNPESPKNTNRTNGSNVKNDGKWRRGGRVKYPPINKPLLDYPPELFSPPPFLPVVEFIVPYIEPEIYDRTLIGMLRNQIEFYFSEENLSRDFFLRRKMDPEGYLPISLIASFQRIQALSQDPEKISIAINSSSKLELKDNNSGLVRTNNNPLKWPISDVPLSPISPTPISMSCAF